MHLLNRFYSFLLAGLLMVCCVSAQEQTEAVFRSDTRLVLLHATVLNNKGHLVTDLPRSAFTVTENEAPQELKLFKREDVPVSLGLIIDNSGSMRDKRQKVAAAALGLVKASNRDDEVFIVNFNDEAYLDVVFTNDIKKMEEGLTRIDSRGGTAMRDAVLMSMDYLKEKGKKDKKVLLVVTDGEDNTSSTSNTLEKLLARAQQSEILIYTIGLLNEEERSKAKRAQRALGALATTTGGLAYFPKELDEVESLALQVAHEIRNQYILAYSPSIQELDGSYRRIQVTAKGPNRPVVRTRSGYYATPDQKPKPGASAPSGATLLKP
ncbi:MAG: VWA domain-containing protein [Acidimicrobiia bacterium]|nr:VWA domain-containing protein [Acidimicrobiia bacterium]